MTAAPRLRVEEVQFFERAVRLRMPFRFGAATLREAPQAFVRVRLRTAGGGTATGTAADLLAPKWFDKDPALTNEQNFAQLRTALGIAAGLYRAAAPTSAFGLAAACYHEQLRRCAEQTLNPLIASFGAAMLDRAILDALCRLEGVSVFDAVAANLPGLDTSLTPDLAGFDLGSFLRGLAAAATIHVRHTVGLLDPLTEAEIAATDRLDDGLPQSLEASIAAYGLTHFKLKLGGELEADLDRLCRIASLLDRQPRRYAVTLDGNEQFAGVAGLRSLLDAVDAAPRLARLRAALLFVEQPLGRGFGLAVDLGEAGGRVPAAIDESDGTMGAFRVARDLGYRGVSSKACKGFYKAILNRARAAAWNDAAGARTFFVSAEDLTTQPGIALQQDTALAALIGCTHVERNGHHYVDGMHGAPETEQRAFHEAHPDLYRASGGRVRLRIADGRITLGSLRCPGLGARLLPSFAAMRACSYDGA